MRKRIAATMIATLLGSALVHGAPPSDTGAHAYTHAVDGLSSAQQQLFRKGRTLFHQVWVITPSLDKDVEGLGPLYNQFSCSSCHLVNGRGNAPDGPDEPMRSMLVRLSIPGKGPHGGPRPSPAYGGQLNEQGIPGVDGEGRARMRWHVLPYRLDDGTTVMLRRPSYRFVDLAYGPMLHMMFSPRVSPAVYGSGLLDAVPASELVALAHQPRADGVTGRVNGVWDVATQRMTVGRFGWKANVPHLEQQVAAAFSGDMGLTSSYFPMSSCTHAQTACRHAPRGRNPELTDAQLRAVTFYVASLAVPARRSPDAPGVRRGEALFARAGCAACHQPTLRTAPTAQSPEGKAFHPYTDLLLHDMGEALSDHRPDFGASGREWRTPPLWGIGLAKRVNPRVTYLHDGRARSIEEAILWHGGEATPARRRFATMSAQDRKALLAFIDSL